MTADPPPELEAFHRFLGSNWLNGGSSLPLKPAGTLACSRIHMVERLRERSSSSRGFDRLEAGDVGQRLELFLAEFRAAESALDMTYASSASTPTRGYAADYDWIAERSLDVPSGGSRVSRSDRACRINPRRAIRFEPDASRRPTRSATCSFSTPTRSHLSCPFTVVDRTPSRAAVEQLRHGRRTPADHEPLECRCTVPETHRFDCNAGVACFTHPTRSTDRSKTAPHPSPPATPPAPRESPPCSLPGGTCSATF